jgi:hypothetical protein
VHSLIILYRTRNDRESRSLLSSFLFLPFFSCAFFRITCPDPSPSRYMNIYCAALHSPFDRFLGPSSNHSQTRLSITFTKLNHAFYKPPTEPKFLPYLYSLPSKYCQPIQSTYLGNTECTDLQSLQYPNKSPQCYKNYTLPCLA